ncbi:hypothetical protein K2X33_16230 [bacterium]|nr:hypothetical protein [bacterium]
MHNTLSFRRLSIVALVLVATPAFALKEFYSISRSTRAMGMGGAFYGLSDDENALFYNPSGLAFANGGGRIKLALKGDMTGNAIPALSEMIEVMQSNSNNVSDVVARLEKYQGQPIYGGATPGFLYYMNKQIAVGLLIADVKGSAALLGRDLDSTLDITAITDSGLFVGFGFPVMPGLAVGANLKAVMRAGGRKTYTVTDIAAGTGFSGDIRSLGGMGGGLDFDLGVTYEHKWGDGMFSRAALVLNNGLASQLDFFRLSGFGSPPTLPRMLTLGTYTQLPGMGVADHIGLLVDFAEFAVGGQTDPDLGARTGSIWKHVNLGVEVPFWGSMFAARMGFRQGNFTAGLGLHASVVDLEFATYAEELATQPGRLTARRWALRLAFGWGSGKPTVAARVAEVETPPLKPGSAPVPVQPQAEPQLAAPIEAGTALN